MSILNALGPMPFDITTLIPIGRLVKCMLKFVSKNKIMMTMVMMLMPRMMRRKLDMLLICPINRQGLADGFTDEFGQHR